MKLQFQPRTGWGSGWIFIVFMAVCAITGILIMLSSMENRLYGAFTTGFCLLMTYLFWSNITGHNCYYEINNKGIFLKRMWLKKQIPFDEISAVSLLNHEQVQQVLFHKQADETRHAGAGDIKQAFRSRREMGQMIQFCIYPIEYIRSGKTYSIKTKGDFISIQLKKGAPFIISPMHCEDFKQRAEQALK